MNYTLKKEVSMWSDMVYGQHLSLRAKRGNPENVRIEELARAGLLRRLRSSRNDRVEDRMFYLL
jgi:hypothetical protein